MFQITVDEKIVDPDSISYHHQDIPRPGGHHYTVFLPLDSKTMEVLENFTGRNRNSHNFLQQVKKLDQSHNNIIELAIEHHYQNNRPGRGIEWVFNTVDNLKINDNYLVIEGRCSQAVDNFSETTPSPLTLHPRKI